MHNAQDNTTPGRPSLPNDSAECCEDALWLKKLAELDGTSDERPNGASEKLPIISETRSMGGSSTQGWFGYAANVWAYCGPKAVPPPSWDYDPRGDEAVGLLADSVEVMPPSIAEVLGVAHGATYAEGASIIQGWMETAERAERERLGPDPEALAREEFPRISEAYANRFLPEDPGDWENCGPAEGKLTIAEILLFLAESTEVMPPSVAANLSLSLGATYAEGVKIVEMYPMSEHERRSGRATTASATSAPSDDTES